MKRLSEVAWPVSGLPEALPALARQCDLPVRQIELTAPAHFTDEATLNTWMDWAADTLGIELEATQVAGAEMESLLSAAAPALVKCSVENEQYFLLLLPGYTRGKLHILGPDLRVHRMPIAELTQALCVQYASRFSAEVEQLLASARIPERDQARVRIALLRERLATVTIRGFWLLRLPPESPFAKQLQYDGIFRGAGMALGVFLSLYLLEILGWWLIGHGALNGQMDLGWLMAWGLLLVSLIPLRLLGMGLSGILVIRAGTLLKQRLLAGALHMSPDAIRHQGVGQLLGRVIESSAFEALALNGGIRVPIAMLELVLALIVLISSGIGTLHALLLLIWTMVAMWLGRRLFLRLQRWTTLRLEMAHDLVERMVGHRTRLAQQAEEAWHEGEDQLLTTYWQASREYDQAAVLLNGILPRGWLLLGILGFLPLLLVGGEIDVLPLAIVLGGVLLGYRAIAEIAGSLTNFAQAWVAWQQVAPIFHAAKAEQSPAIFHAPAEHDEESGKRMPIVEGWDLVFRYRAQGAPVLDNCNVSILGGERVLLQGASGGGKSSLAALLSGARKQESGLLLLQGLDSGAWGMRNWRKAVAYAPQFHENYIFSAPLAFNVLMGRRWPPEQQDLIDAESLCRELGLDNLLDNMPAGFMQMVGETGWRLSHGERSRVFLARALLQDAKVIVLDESFGALDPQTMEWCLRLVMERAPTLVVIAHP